MSQKAKIYYPKKDAKPCVTLKEYQKIRQEAQTDSSVFWAKIAREKIVWDKDFTLVKNTSYAPDNVHIEWFGDGMMNICYNAVDRHAHNTPDKTALIWESDCGTISKTYSFSELYKEVSHFASVLKEMGVTKGDRVAIYMPMIPEASFAMLACSRLGAIHCVVFGGFSANALKDRIIAADAKWVITADEGVRGGKIIPLKQNVDKALEDITSVQTVLVIERTQNPDVSYKARRDIKYTDIAGTVAKDCPYVPVDAEHPLFILYTSGSTGSPKGLVHTTGGYSVYVSYTFSLVFDIKPDDIFFCTADVGWITGHSYLVYAPLINGTTILMFEGVPTFPNAGRLWQITEKYCATILYTAPTALRTLMGFGDEYINSYDLSSLRVLGTVGEPINPEVWEWYYRVIGKENCPIVDTWWQTETGGILMSSVANTTPMKAGCAGEALPSIMAQIVDNDGNILEGEASGHLVISDSWPAQARSIWGDHKRFTETYFTTYPNFYCTGDGCKRDADGYFQITGRTDDVLNVSGHRLGTAEIESALVKHQSVSEAAVVGFPHDIKGQGIYAYVTLMQGENETDDLHKELKHIVRQEIGAIATIDIIHITSDMPKTRSGKIMRRILRKIAEKELDNLGDISTLANPDIVAEIIKNVRDMA